MNTKNLFLGAIFVLLGLLLLGRNLGWFAFDWSELLRFWPVLIILLGINVLWGRGSVAGTVVLVILISLAIPATIVRHIRDDWRDNHRLNWEWSDRDRNDDRPARRRSGASSGTRRLVEPYTDSLSAATFRLRGGAAEFKLRNTTRELVEADARLRFGSASLQKRATNGQTQLTLAMNEKNGGTFWNGDDFDNRVDLRLNPAPRWTVDVAFGAGTVDFDLSPYHVESLKLQTGVASARVRLGDRAPATTVAVESGVAEVTIEVPRGVGCRIETDGALNQKDFDQNDFVRVGSAYETPGFAQATRTITIRFDGGLGKWKVKRY
jgi:hypothetical protein